MLVPLRIFLYTLFLTIVLPSSAQASTKIEITGIGGVLKKNVELTIGTPPNDSEKAIKAFLTKVDALSTKSLQAKGYYNSKVKSTHTLSSDNQKSQNFIRIHIDPGLSVKIRSLQIEIDGDIENDVKLAALIKALPIAVGDLLDHGLYELAKKQFLDLAQDRGYFDGKFVRNSVTVDSVKNHADVDLKFDSGSRYKIGTIEINSDVFTLEFLRRWIPFESGIPYESKHIIDLTRQFQSSGYFSKVRVQTLYDKSVHAVVPIKVSLVATEKNKIGVGLGIATDTGPRAKFTWRRPHHNEHGHSISFSTGASDIRQEATVQYKIPRVHKPLTDYWEIDLGAQNEENEDAKSQLRTINFQRVKETRKRWQESVFVRWENEKFVAGGKSDTTNLILPGVSWSRSRTKGGLNPSSGTLLSLQIMGASKNLFSDIDLLKGVVSFKWLRTLYPRHKVILNLDYGAIETNDFDRLPTSQRFYVGGDRSIRGFHYNTISPENQNGELTGGRFKEVVSLEYDYRFKDRWSAALFVDAGRAFNHFDERYRVGTGFGIRWHSPVGPVRLDLGFGVSEDDVPILFHLSIGPDI